MIKHYLLFFLVSFSFFYAQAQQFYRAGSETNVETEPQFGILLAGGATDNNDGMKWLAARANGGDVVVLRASGSDGYNNYILNQLGENINSVTSIVIIGSAQANNPNVCQAVDNAEMIFIAGGDQWYYYDEWKGTCLQEALNRHVNEKRAPIGGTSAGLAVLGEVVYTAENGTVTSAQALSDPYHNRITLEKDFLNIPFMKDIVTDSHYDERERQGRHTVFLARMIKDWQLDAKGIGVDEYTAVGVDENGLARVFGHPAHNDYAYFLRANGSPEVCEAGQPLTWNNQEKAVTVYRLKGTYAGTNTFDLANWKQGQGGDRWSWYVIDGELHRVETSGVSVPFYATTSVLNIFPNPAALFVRVESPREDPIFAYVLHDINGQQIRNEKVNGLNSVRVDLSAQTAGTYLLTVYYGNSMEVRKIIRKD